MLRCRPGQNATLFCVNRILETGYFAFTFGTFMNSQNYMSGLLCFMTLHITLHIWRNRSQFLVSRRVTQECFTDRDQFLRLSAQSCKCRVVKAWNVIVTSLPGTVKEFSSWNRSRFCSDTNTDDEMGTWWLKCHFIERRFIALIERYKTGLVAHDFLKDKIKICICFLLFWYSSECFDFFGCYFSPGTPVGLSYKLASFSEGKIIRISFSTY